MSTPTALDDQLAPTVVVGVGASAGGVEALSRLVRNLRPDLSAALFVVLHVAPAGTSVLAQILDRAGPLPAVAATDGEPIRRGVIYVAPPDRHLLIEDGAIRLTAGPRENGHRPAIDPTFRSLAAYAERAVGVILSGTRDDGTQGLAQIKAAGGTALVQDPDEAAYGGMIDSAMSHVAVDQVLPVAHLALRLAELSGRNTAMTDANADELPEREQSSTRYTCPECGGHVQREESAGVLRYVCMVGHAYAPESLDHEQANAVEGTLWTAIRLLGDRSQLLAEMSEQASQRGHARTAEGFRLQAEDARQAALAVRSLLEDGRIPTSGNAAEAA